MKFAVVRLHCGVKILTILFNKTNGYKIKVSTKASDPSSAKIYFMALYDTFLKKTEKACVRS
jgi:hypothetical protein